MKIAIVHDFLTQNGGAEKVLTALCEIYPDAPVYVLFYDREKISNTITKAPIYTSFLQQIPFAKTHYQWYLPLMPAAIEHFCLNEYDLVISSSSAFAKGIITRPDTLHICYCHTPTRYLWTDSHEYIQGLRYPSFIKKLLPPILTKLRMWDQLVAQRVDEFIANSKTVQERIHKYYRQSATIIHPPVDTTKFTKAQTIDDYYLAGGRLVPYKKFDLIIEVFNKLKKPLKIFGVGPEYLKLKNIAGSTIEFCGRVSHAELNELYGRARFFIHPQEEDLGITAIESMATGRPVIGYSCGGLLETMIDKKTGVFFHEQGTRALIDAIRLGDTLSFDNEFIQTHAKQFDTAIFKKNIQNHVNESFNRFAYKRKPL